jgi:hypothetical protein
MIFFHDTESQLASFLLHATATFFYQRIHLLDYYYGLHNSTTQQTLADVYQKLKSKVTTHKNMRFFPIFQLSTLLSSSEESVSCSMSNTDFK